MSDECLGSERLARHADGELTVNEAAVVTKHLTGCATCRKELALVRELMGQIATRTPTRAQGRNEDRFVSGVLARIEAQRQADQPRLWTFPWRLPAWTWGMALAAATAVVLLPRFTGNQPGREMEVAEFASRGGGAPQASLAKRVGAEIQILRDGELVADDERRLRAEDRFTARYDNLVTDRPVYLMIFALDAADDVHWIFPGYPDASSDPAAVLLEPGARARALGEVVQLDAPAAGALRVMMVFSSQQRRVKAVESLLAGKREGQPPASLFKGDVVTERVFRWQP